MVYIKISGAQKLRFSFCLAAIHGARGQTARGGKTPFKRLFLFGGILIYPPRRNSLKWAKNQARTATAHATRNATRATGEKAHVTPTAAGQERPRQERGAPSTENRPPHQPHRQPNRQPRPREVSVGKLSGHRKRPRPKARSVLFTLFLWSLLRGFWANCR